MKLIFCFLVSIALSFFLTPIFAKLAKKWKVVDKPAKRKMHKTAMPVMGGFAIVISVIVCSILKPYILGKGFPLLMGGIVIFAVNAIDDIKGLSARYRIGVEAIVTLVLVLNGIRVTFLPAGLWGNSIEIILTFIWFLGVTNAFNYLDGLDGLATGSACINFFYFSSVLFLIGQERLGFLALIILGSCLGFLPHNFPKARIFLGDAGSTFLGFMLAGIAILGNWAQSDAVKVCIPILILGVPIFDMIFTTILRIKQGKVKTVIEWLRYGGKDHFHHYLSYLGLKPNGAVMFIWAFSFSLGLSAVMLSNDTPLEGLLTLVQSSIIFAIIGVLIVVGKKRRPTTT